MSRVGSSVVITVCLLTVCLPLAGPVAAAETSTQRAKRHNAAAERLFNLGLFEQAAEEYQRAYRAKPVPDFLYNLAQCYRRLDTVTDLERALFYFKSYLRNAPRTPLRRVVVEAMRKTEQRLSLLRLASKQPASAPASASIAASLPSRLSRVAAPPAGASTLPAVQLDAPAPRRPALTRSTPVYKRWWFWTVVGGVLTAAAVTSAAVVLSRGSGSVEGSLPPGTMKVQLP